MADLCARGCLCFPAQLLCSKCIPSQTSILLNRCPHIVCEGEHPSSSSEMIQPQTDKRGVGSKQEKGGIKSH